MRQPKLPKEANGESEAAMFVEMPPKGTQRQAMSFGNAPKEGTKKVPQKQFERRICIKVSAEIDNVSSEVSIHILSTGKRYTYDERN